MNYDPNKHHRHSIRLQGYDYAQAGAYFVTVCTAERCDLLAKIEGGRVYLSRFGEIVQGAWSDLPWHYPHVILDAFCIMPNHVHGIIILDDSYGKGGSGFSGNYPTANCRGGFGTSGRYEVPENILSGTYPMPEREPRPYNGRHALPEVVRAFKSFSARRINRLTGTKGRPFWQRNYYERIIRDEAGLMRIRKYIQENPANWETDQEYPPAGRGDANGSMG